MHVEQSSLENYFLLPNKQTKNIVFTDFSRLENVQSFSIYFQTP